MQVIVIREARDGSANGGADLLRYALSTAPLGDLVLEGLGRLWQDPAGGAAAPWMGRTEPDELLWVLPENWRTDWAARPGRTIFYSVALTMDLAEGEDRHRRPWVAIANGRFAAYVNHQLVGQLLETTPADMIAVTATSDLMAGREKLRLTQDNKVVGYRRLYADCMSPLPLPADWPHLLLVRHTVLAAVWNGGLLADFAPWADRCRAAGLTLQSVAVAGLAYDLESEEGVLAVSQVTLSGAPGSGTAGTWGAEERQALGGDDCRISPQSRLIGPVLLGRQVTVEADAVVVGPTVLCDGSAVGQEAIVDSAIVGTGVSVARRQAVAGCVLTASGRWPGAEPAAAPRAGRSREPGTLRHPGVFRSWPRLSYARCFKRIADVVAAVLILILFAPVIPVIALAVKLSSPGPVFFRDKRQGLHGRSFRCMKFRTMRPGADKMQDKLRFVSEVDGPQFKMADDPRITTVGRFLRETYLDEIPQFFNVLWGQMSVVGPRPSPEAENTLCPSWRDARLSVRPGITGLWQVYRTREPYQDFQEWIHYDTQYVREFSFALDLWICWRTFTKMVKNFVSQF